jgi:hypothetical protein
MSLRKIYGTFLFCMGYSMKFARIIKTNLEETGCEDVNIEQAETCLYPAILCYREYAVRTTNTN